MRPNTPRAPFSTDIRCIECDKPADGLAIGWKAYLSSCSEDEPLEVLIYCPAGAARECGRAV